ncbi:MAG: thiamine pyrophosphate-dependent enzyme, partial [Gaiellales bacterium]
MATEASGQTHLEAADGVIPCVESPRIAHDTQLALLRLCLLQRSVEERAMALYRQGRIHGSYYDGRGQEAVGAAAGLAMGPDDVVAPLNRELACHLARGVTVTDVFSNFLGRATGPTRGRDGNMHFGMREHDVFPLISMLGVLCPVTVGAALAFKRRGEPRVALTFWGDGAMCTGDVHEGLNLAGVLEVPAVFVIQNNQYAYSTP